MRLLTEISSVDDLIIHDHQVTPGIYIISVLITQVISKEQIRDSPAVLERIGHELAKKWGLKKNTERGFNEGFLDFIQSENTLEFVYARESTTKLDRITSSRKPRIGTVRLRTVNPSNKVRVSIRLVDSKFEVNLFGGTDSLISLVSSLVNNSVRNFCIGGHDTPRPNISKEGMYDILQAFGREVEYIYVDPGQSERLKKVAKVKKIDSEDFEQIYAVKTKFRGFRIILSPLVQETIRESGVVIREIEGRLNYEGARITTRISSNGRVIFYIPSKLLGDGMEVEQIAEEMYKNATGGRVVGSRQTNVDSFL